MEPGVQQTVKLEKREDSFDGCRTVPAQTAPDMSQMFAAMKKQAEAIAKHRIFM